MIWLDMDGPLADFDAHYQKLIGEKPTRYPLPDNLDWAKVANFPDFFLTIPVAEGARELFDCVRKINGGWTGVLTGIPSSIAASDNQKRTWADREFKPSKIVCCSAKLKWQWCVPGDVLVDDYIKYRVDWETAGGVFVHHTSAADSIRQLGELVRCGRIKDLSLPS